MVYNKYVTPCAPGSRAFPYIAGEPPPPTLLEGFTLTDIWQTIQIAVWNVAHRISPADVVDILIVAVLIYELIMLTRQTRGSAVLKGFLLLVAATGVSNLLGLTALNWVLMRVFNELTLVLIILFQPELRKALEQVGRGRLIGSGRRSDEAEERSRMISEIITCLTDLSRRKVGALIVLEQNTGLQDVIETGTTIDGLVSAPLLENIFEPNTPLHDGAVVIRGTRVVAGACILTLTESNSVSRELGTRHRAALGVSETTDAVALIASEETGIISVARGGKLTRHMDAKSLRTLLEGLYEEPVTSLRGILHSWLSRKEAAK